jgi:hypothetical protein
MSLYEKLSETADRLVAKFGQDIEIMRASTSEPNPVTGVGEDRTGGPYDAIAVLLPYPDRVIDGTRIQAGDRNLIMSVGDADYAPILSDRPIVNEQEWTIVKIDTISPAGTDVLYKLQVRQ